MSTRVKSQEKSHAQEREREDLDGFGWVWCEGQTGLEDMIGQSVLYVHALASLFPLLSSFFSLCPLLFVWTGEQRCYTERDVDVAHTHAERENEWMEEGFAFSNWGWERERDDSNDVLPMAITPLQTLIRNQEQDSCLLVVVVLVCLSVLWAILSFCLLSDNCHLALLPLSIRPH